jgi:hypothetical protein
MGNAISLLSPRYSPLSFQWEKSLCRQRNRTGLLIKTAQKYIMKKNIQKLIVIFDGGQQQTYWCILTPDWNTCKCFHVVEGLFWQMLKHGFGTF